MGAAVPEPRQCNISSWRQLTYTGIMRNMTNTQSFMANILVLK